MVKVIIFAVLLVIVAIMLLAIILNGIVFIIKKIKHANAAPVLTRLKKTTVITVIISILCAGFVFFTQLTASTPPIHNESGTVIEGSISELRQVTLNGRKEWISIRGNNTSNPVLLFLAGGPGGTQMAAVRYDLAELEKYFIVVNWDQPGSGKSYSAIARNDLTTEIYIEDGYALSQYLCTEFNQEKIYLLGESWGSALGIFMADRYPELYHAFIGTGQMVAFEQTEILDYNLALEIARQSNNSDLVSTLEQNGPPPYYGNDVTWKSAAYLNYLSGIMAQNPEIQNGGFNTYRDLAASEYGILDKINYLRGIVNTFNHVYPQLYPIDLRADYNMLQVPTYFFLGKHDINAPISLVEEYFDLLNAPYKEIVWFEHSGHNPWINESGAFVKEVLRVANIEEK